jgi:outer membrane protein OmpA-like peptidoglycan-associated protein
MRRVSSIFLSLGLIATGVAFVATNANAAPGDLTTATSAAFAPAAISGATPARLIRLPVANAYLAFGRVISTAGAHNYLWKINADLTIDTTFGAVDLGDEFAYPTSSQTFCTSTCLSGRVDTVIINERLGKYAVSYSRDMKGTSNTNASITSIAVGSLSSGAVIAKSMFLSLDGTTTTAADYSAITTNELAKDQCTAGPGASINNIPMSKSSLSTYGMQFRPDGSVFIGVKCDYSNFSLLSAQSSGTLKLTSAFLYAGLKVSGATLAVDTSFGTSGQTVIADGASTCTALSFPNANVDSSITSVSSTQPYYFHMTSEHAKTTTLPFMYSFYSYITGFDGCDSFSIGNSYTNKLLPLTASGTALPPQTVSTGSSAINVTRWIIDTAGRWNALLQIRSGSTTTYSALRLVNGVLDTTLGANGQKVLTGLPATVSVGGTTVNMSYNISGLVNTAAGSYFTGFASVNGSTGMCDNSSTVTNKLYAYHLSFDTGLLTSYGTNGLGAEGSYSNANNAMCEGTVTTATYTDSIGRFNYLVTVPTVSSQSAGFLRFTWDAATGVTSGGDGDTGIEVAPVPTTTIPAATTTTLATTTTTTIAKTTTTTVAKNRIDTRVYSKNLPVMSQRNTALQVLSTKDATKFNIQTTTPKICTPLSSAVLLVNPGRCVIQVVDANTKKIIRSSSTLVKNTASLRGSVLSTSNPIDFDFAQIDLTKTAKVQIQAIAKLARGARHIAIISHTASLTNFYAWNLAISRGRAQIVKSALQNAGVKASIEIVALTNAQPFVSKSANSSQAKNRRVEVYIFPS